MSIVYAALAGLGGGIIAVLALLAAAAKLAPRIMQRALQQSMLKPSGASFGDQAAGKVRQ